MNDLATPFLAVFLSEVLPGPLHTWSAGGLTEVQRGRKRGAAAGWMALRLLWRSGQHRNAQRAITVCV
jgi:hypothetical protein